MISLIEQFRVSEAQESCTQLFFQQNIQNKVSCTHVQTELICLLPHVDLAFSCTENNNDLVKM